MSQSQPPYPKFPEQNADGVDLSLIRENMRRSATERVRRADRFLRDMERLRSQLPEQSRRAFEQLMASRR